MNDTHTTAASADIFFSLSEPMPIDELRSELSSLFAIIEAPSCSLHETLLDTFDWRLYGRGWRLAWQYLFA